ncbi:MAG: hypothetical protein OEW85_11015 [Acidimicrobiia bacterium]|nr:hypothetical protein [Acidimicrobiia bacterium]
MSRRLEVELTSVRDDGRWTWRAAGAKQPKGEVDAVLLFDGAKVGDVVKVEAEFFIDGISVTQVFPPKQKVRNEPERLELLGSEREPGGVTTQLVGKKGRRGDDRGRDRDRDRDRKRKRPDRKDRGDGRDAKERDRGSRPRREHAPAPERPKVPRLKAGRAHRKAALEALPEVQRPIAEQLLRGGIPALRQAVDKQNEVAKAEGKPLVKADPLVGLAEQIYPALRTAEWRDRADAAMAGIDEVDLRDLRSVVVAADTAARDDETRALASDLREALLRRVDAEHNNWLSEIAGTLADGRTVRALRLSSRPPKAGAPLPTDLAARLAAAASEGLAADTGQERYATVLDAVAFSPVRTLVTPAAVPDKPGTELIEAVTRLSSRIPQVAGLFGIEPSEAPSSARRRPKRSSRTGGAKPIPPPPPAADTAAERPAPASTAEHPEPTAEPAGEADVASPPADPSPEVYEATAPPSETHEPVAYSESPAEPAEAPAAAESPADGTP